MYIFLSAFPHGSAGARIHTHTHTHTHTHIQMSSRDVLSKILNSMNVHKGYLKEQRIAFCAYTASLKPLLREVNFKKPARECDWLQQVVCFLQCKYDWMAETSINATPLKSPGRLIRCHFCRDRPLLWNPSCDLNKISSQSVYYAVCLLLIFLFLFIFSNSRWNYSMQNVVGYCLCLFENECKCTHNK